MMKAVVLKQAGGIENLSITEVPKANAAENEVLIEVKAISINPADAKVRADEQGVKMMYANQDRVILGWDVAGVVVSKGEKVNQFEIGDRVFGMVNFPGAGNAYAEYVTSPDNQLAKIPSNTSFEEAAASTLAALTALQVLQGNIKKEDRVLIHAGSGGVGHFAIQMAKSMGAYVIATSSAKNRDFVMSQGADEHIDYRSQAFEEVLSDIDFVLDPMGGQTLINSIKVLKEGGQLISLAIFEVPENVKALADELKVNVRPLLVKSDGEGMKTISNQLKNGTLKPHITKTFNFEDMALAHTEIESGRTIGKIVVTL